MIKCATYSLLDCSSLANIKWKAFKINIFKRSKKLTSEELANIIGGYNATDCRNHLIGGISSGAIAGGVGSGLVTLGVGGPAEAFVGAHIGAIAGGITCMGGMIGNNIKF